LLEPARALGKRGAVIGGGSNALDTWTPRVAGAYPRQLGHDIGPGTEEGWRADGTGGRLGGPNAGAASFRSESRRAGAGEKSGASGSGSGGGKGAEAGICGGSSS